MYSRFVRAILFTIWEPRHGVQLAMAGIVVAGGFDDAREEEEQAQIEEGELSQSRGLAEKELAMKTWTNLLVVPPPLHFMGVELLRRLDRASLRPLRGVGLHGTHQVKVTLVKAMSITDGAIRPLQ